MKSVKNILGNKYDRLLVIQFSRIQNGDARWFCLCNCGAKKEVAAKHLKSGNVTSCGCKNREAKNVKHGMSNSPIYRRWGRMLERCFNKRNVSYCDYGGRGITVCKRWLSFENFYSDMSGSFEKNLTLERVNNSGNYEPKNCKWVTLIEQSHNKRNNVKYKGECIAEANRRLKLTAGGIAARIRLGWTLERAFSTYKTNKWQNENNL